MQKLENSTRNTCRPSAVKSLLFPVLFLLCQLRDHFNSASIFRQENLVEATGYRRSVSPPRIVIVFFG